MILHQQSPYNLEQWSCNAHLGGYFGGHGCWVVLQPQNPHCSTPLGSASPCVLRWVCPNTSGNERQNEKTTAVPEWLTKRSTYLALHVSGVLQGASTNESSIAQTEIMPNPYEGHSAPGTQSPQLCKGSVGRWHYPTVVGGGWEIHCCALTSLLSSTPQLLVP